MKSQGPITRLAQYPSESNPDHMHDILLGEDEVVYCTCARWRFQKGVQPKDRTCPHIERYTRENPAAARRLGL